MRKIFGAIVLLIVITAASVVNAKELVILHTNDIHGRILSTDNNGQSIGFAEMTAAVRAIKADNPNALWLDAGDATQGLPYVNLSKGRTMVTLMNAAKPDAFTLGNHEFDYGLDNLESLIDYANFDIVDANVSRKDDDKLLVPPYKIFKLPNKLKVAVFGLTTPESAYKVRPSMVANVNFLDPIETARQMVKKLRSKCDVLIALTHLGIEKNADVTSIRLAAEVPGIDLIVDGHSHTFLSEGVTIGKTLIVQAGCHAQALGCTLIEVDKHKVTAKKSMLLDKDKVIDLAQSPDPEITTIIESIKATNDELLNVVLAQNGRALSGEVELLRAEEAELGDLVADAFRWRSNADFAVINGGGLRATLPQGNVTRRNVLSVFPFVNEVEVVEIQGSTIRQMLEHSVSVYPQPFAGFLQVSGIKFDFDPFNSAGERVGEIYINDELLDDSKIYKMATCDFLFEAGDGYTMLKDLLVTGYFGTCDEVLADYVKEIGTRNIDFGRVTNIRAYISQKAA